MKQKLSDRSSIAWFRLEEFIVRGERERALGVYRLLTHSIGNEPFLKKLEAELLMRFGTGDAQREFIEAARLYAKAGNLFEAIQIYEYVANRPEHFREIISWAAELGLDHKVEIYQKKLSIF